LIFIPSAIYSRYNGGLEQMQETRMWKTPNPNSGKGFIQSINTKIEDINIPQIPFTWSFY
jgi:hypothetical protein